MKYILLLLTLATLSACSSLEAISDGAANKVAKGVNKYCDETDQDFREKFREKVNSELNGASIMVDCNE